MRRLAVQAVLCGVAMNAFAQSPRDFSTGFDLTLDEAGPVYEVPLPMAVYRASRTPDLGDLRVFNAAGEVVPHALAPNAPIRQEERRLIGVPVFPAPRSASGSDELVLRFRRNPSGGLELVDPSADLPGEADRRLILDLSRVEGLVATLHFRWPGSREAFVQAVTVSGSEDLVQWRVLVERATLAHLRRGGRTLRRDRIDLGAVRSRYLQIEFGSNSPPPTISSVLVEPAPARRGETLRWTPVTLAPDPAKPGRFLFELPRPLPVRRIQVKAVERNTLTRATFFSRDGLESKWRRIGRMSVYNLEFEGGAVGNTSIPVTGGRKRYWGLEADRSGGGFGATPPQVSVGWSPRLMVFVARGNPPYTIAVGSEQVTTGPAGAQEVLSVAQSPAGSGDGTLGFATATVGDARELGGAEALEPPRAPVDWKTWLVWIALAGGAGVMAWMAVSLLRESAGRRPE